MHFGKGVKGDWPTLTALADSYQKNAAFRLLVEGLVIDSYQDKLTGRRNRLLAQGSLTRHDGGGDS